MSRLDIPQVSKGFFATVMPFRTEEGKARYDAAGLRATIQEVLAAQEAAAGSRRVDYEIYEHARYAMVGLVDELAIVSEWAHRTDWAMEPLELSIFNSNVAGEDFYERLDTLKKRYAQSREDEERETILGALEVLFTCLECGFKGRYRGGGEAELTAIHSGLLSMLWPEKEARAPTMFPGAYAEAGNIDPGRRARNRWPLILLGCVLLLVGLYVAFSFMLGGRANSITGSMDNDVDRVLGIEEGGD